MINSNFFLGLPVAFQDICSVYPPKVKDILNTKNYAVYRKLFLSSQEDIEDEYTELKMSLDDVPTPLEYLFLMCESDPRIKDIVIEGFQFFIKEPVTLLSDQKIIVVGELKEVLTTIKSVDELRIIKEDNYFEFQQLLRRSIGEKEVEPYDPNLHPKVKYFKAKARLRDRVKAKSKENLTLGSTLAAICCMDLNLNPLNIGELSQAAISVLVRYYQEKQKYEIDIKSLLAGADSKKVKPQNWIRNIEDL